jgi:NtrC-family two-component system response regulator AlgB
MRILIVDDELNIRKTLRVALESMKHTVEEAAGVDEALKRTA